MKILTIIISVIILSSCSHKEKQELYEEVFTDKNNYHVVVIDSCEYLYLPNGDSSWGTHKGNCKFCKNRLETNKK